MIDLVALSVVIGGKNEILFIARVTEQIVNVTVSIEEVTAAVIDLRRTAVDLLRVIARVAVARTANSDRQTGTVDDLNELIAVEEGFRANARHAAAECHACQRAAVVKRIGAYRRDRIRYIDSRQAVTAVECVIANACYAVAECHGVQIRAVVECVSINLVALSVVIGGKNEILFIARVTEQIVNVTVSIEEVTAAVIDLRRTAVDLLRVIARVAVARTANSDRQPGTVDDLNELIAVTERIGADGRYARGNKNARQIFVAFERVRGNFRNRIITDHTGDHKLRIGTGTDARDRTVRTVYRIRKSLRAVCVNRACEDFSADRAGSLLQAVLRLGRGRYDFPLTRHVTGSKHRRTADRTDLIQRTAFLGQRMVSDLFDQHFIAHRAANIVHTERLQRRKIFLRRVNEKIVSGYRDQLYVSAVIAIRNAVILAVGNADGITLLQGKGDRSPSRRARTGYVDLLRGIMLDRESVVTAFRRNSVLQFQRAGFLRRDSIGRRGAVRMIRGNQYAVLQTEGIIRIVFKLKSPVQLMTERRYQFFSAYRTGLRRRTGRRRAGCMRQLGSQLRAAHRTGLRRRAGRCRAGRMDRDQKSFLLSAAAGAGSFLFTGLGAGLRFRHDPFAEAVSASEK